MSIESGAPIVFISYSHDSDEHRERVLALSNRLRSEGIACHIDRYYEVPPPVEGWQEWMIRQIERADFTLLVCTTPYYERFRKLTSSGGLGGKWEGAIITNELYASGTLNAKFFPIGFVPYNDAKESIPEPVRSTNYYPVADDAGYEKLYRHLTNQPETPAPPLGTRRNLSSPTGSETAAAPSEAANRTPVTESAPLESPTGAVPLGSKFYIARAEEARILQCVEHHQGMAVILGARQMGKTTLLARAMQHARENQAQVVVTDLQTLETSDLTDAHAFYFALADRIAMQLGLPGDWEAGWNPKRSAGFNMERFLTERVLRAFPEPFVWGIDEADRLLELPYGEAVFAQFRAWYNNRANFPDGAWNRLTLVLACANEPGHFITDPNQSPFNVGEQTRLQDFNAAEVAKLKRLHNLSHTDDALKPLNERLNGHPYLTRRAFYELAYVNPDVAALLSNAATDDGVFGTHLRRLLRLVQNDGDLRAGVKAILREEECANEALFYRLLVEGFVNGKSHLDAHIRCPLYQDYFTRHLLQGGQTIDRTTLVLKLNALGAPDLALLISSLPGAANYILADNLPGRVAQLIAWAESANGAGLSNVCQVAQRLFPRVFPPAP